MGNALWDVAGSFCVLGACGHSFGSRGQSPMTSSACPDQEQHPPDERIAACTRAINSGRWKGSGLAWAYENRSIAYHDKGDLDRSKADFNQALKLYPPSHAEFTRCAGLYGDAAIAACTRAINSGAFRGDQLAKIYLNRGIEYGGKGNHDRAIEDFSEAIRLWPNYASAYYRRGLSRARQGR